MAIKKPEEIIAGLKELIGDRTDEAALNVLEDVDDTLKDYSTNANIDWKAKYDENDAAWKKKYKDRFFGKPVQEDEPEPPEEKKLTFEELFKEE